MPDLKHLQMKYSKAGHKYLEQERATMVRENLRCILENITHEQSIQLARQKKIIEGDRFFIHHGWICRPAEKVKKDNAA